MSKIDPSTYNFEPITEHQQEELLKANISSGFLKQLTTVARLYGWKGDYYEIANFVEALHKVDGQDVPKGLNDPVEIYPVGLVPD